MSIASGASMKDARLHRLTALFRLRHMLGQTISDEHAARDLDPERAGHLHDAVNDLRNLIGRLESELSESTAPQQKSGGVVGGQRMEQAEKTEHSTT
jgi:hypothetical protein